MNVMPLCFTSVIVEFNFSVRRSDKISPIFIIVTLNGIEKKMGI